MDQWSINPLPGDVGFHEVELELNDGVENTSSVFQIVVSVDMQSPGMAVPLPLSFNLTAISDPPYVYDFSTHFNHPTGDPLMFEYTLYIKGRKQGGSLPSWLTLSGTGDSIVTFENTHVWEKEDG